MIKKLNMISVSVVLTVIVFFATTAVQKIFVDYEPTVKVLVAVQDIQVNRPLDRFMFKTLDVPLSLVMNLRVIKRIEDIRDHYSVEPIHKGEILRAEAVALRNEIKIIEVGEGQEKVSVKIKAPENAVSYQIKTGDKVNLYFTGRLSVIKNLASSRDSYIPENVDSRDSDYGTVRLLESVNILGVFDEEGNALSDTQRNIKIDSVVFGVGHEDAKIINNLKGQGVFDITGLPYTL